MTPECTQLDTGLTVVSLTLPRVQTVSIGLYAGVGARFETAQNNGISHFLEHMVFKGSQRRSARQLAEAVEDVGGAINAYTARDVTSFYIRLLQHDAPLAMDILSDLVFGASLDQREVDKERDVILQEIGQVMDTPEDLVFDVLLQTAFSDQPFGGPILGTTKTVSNITAEALKAFRAAHYVCGNLVLSAAGHIEHDALVRLAKQHFSQVSQGRKILPSEATWHAGDARLERPAEQLHMALGFPGFALDDPHVYALQVVSTMLGGGMSSRLFQQVREEHGLAYSIFSDVSAHAGTGMLSIYVGTSPQDAAKALGLIAQCCTALKTADDARELNRAKAQLKTGLAMALESSASLAEQIGRQQLAFGRTITPDELIAKVDAVSLDDARQIARQCLTNEVAFACVGPAAQLPDTAELKALFE
ncbi:MAG: pitrilysin family protein [Pseudomonadota bacterium]